MKPTPEQVTEQVTLMALEAGFMITTLCGQDTNKAMPVSDRATLVKFAQMIRDKALDQASEVAMSYFKRESIKSDGTLMGESLAKVTEESINKTRGVQMVAQRLIAAAIQALKDKGDE